MKKSFVLCLALAVPVVACASDPNKKAMEAQKEETEKAEKNAEKSAEQAKKSQEEAIKQQSEQAKKQAEALPEGSKERAKTQADVAAERQKYMADAQTRDQKLSARIQEVQQKARLARGNVPASTTDKINEAARLNASVSAEIGRLPQVPNQSWSQEQKGLDARLDQVEALVGDAESEVKKAMP